MGASATALAYAIVVVDAVLLVAAILQTIYAVHAKRREARGTPSAPARSILVLIIASACLIPSYVFDLSATALLLVKHSTTPPPTGPHLALVVVSLVLSEGFAPAFTYIAAFDIIKARVAQSSAELATPRSTQHKLRQRVVENALCFLLPATVVVYLGLFCKAMLDTPTTPEIYYAYLNAGKYLYRASLAIQALLFVRVAYRAVTAHLANNRHGERDPIIFGSILCAFVPATFIRTLAFLAFAPLASSYATASKPASSTGLQLATSVLCGLTIVIAIQSLLGAAMRPAGHWSSPASSGTPNNKEEDDMPGDIVGSGKKAHRRHDSFAMSPTRGGFNFQHGIEIERVETRD